MLLLNRVNRSKITVPLLLAAVAVILVSVSYSSAQKTTIKKDSVIDGQYNIYDKRGTKKGYIKEDPLFEDRYNVYDKHGNRQGYWKEDPLFKDRYTSERKELYKGRCCVR